MGNTPTPKVYGAILAVMDAMAKEGIGKERRNQQQGFAFRGIDDVYASLCEKLVVAKLLMLPRVTEERHDDRTTKNGGGLIYATLKVEYDLISAEDGSKTTICTVGEAMDSGDKASNKAMSAAYKYAAIQAFCIPTVGSDDADAESHDLAPRHPPQDEPTGQRQAPQRGQARGQQRGQAQQQPQGAQQPTSKQIDDLKAKLKAAAEKGATAFNAEWQANKGLARKAVMADGNAMLEYKRLCDEADHAEGNQPQQAAE